MRDEDTVTTVISRLHAMDLIMFRQGRASRVMRVPVPFGFLELSMYTGMFFSTAGSTVKGCRTFAPKYASSDASSKEISFTFHAELTIRGSAVIMPSTSVQI